MKMVLLDTMDKTSRMLQQQPLKTNFGLERSCIEGFNKEMSSITHTFCTMLKGHTIDACAELKKIEVDLS
jgi:hypothetical protein